MKRLLLFLALALYSFPALATTHYLDSSVTTSGNGAAWATAWKNFGNITGLSPGDIVMISGGASGQTYTTGQFLSASGTSGHPITYQAASDAGHSGLITISSNGSDPNFFYANASQGIGQWVTWNGNVGNAKNIVMTGWDPIAQTDGSSGLVFSYVTINGQIHANGTLGMILDHVTIDLPSGDDRAVQGGLSCSGTAGYGQSLIHDSIFRLRYGGTSGFGDDGIGGMECTDFYNNQVLGISDPSYAGSQHQDGIQTGGQYNRIYNNFFQNMQNYPIYGDQVGGGTLQHWRIYNNIFNDPVTSAGNQAVSIGCDGTTCTMSDIIVANNTAVANTNCIFLNQGTAGTLTTSFVVNNICYNSGALQVSTATNSNNTTATTGIVFVNSTSDWHLTSGATNAIGQGINPAPSYLTSVYTTDKDGLTRTNPWDIGAYEFVSTTTVATPTATPAAGTYVTAHTVTLATTTAGSAICLTINGIPPTAPTAGTCGAGSTTYTGPLSVGVNQTIQALATHTGDTNSSVLTAAYTITGTTWYIRPDGGTSAQCTGKANAAYPGSGSAQACSFSHPYWMMNSAGNWANFIGGDTIQFVNTSGTSDTYFTGEQNSGVGFDWHGAGINTGECPVPNSGSGAAGCILPTLPSGVVGPTGTTPRHTRVLGQNVGSCHDSGHTHLVNPTILSGISGAFGILDLRASNYVDISCVAVTQPDTCTAVVISPGQCNHSTSNYVGFGGLILNYEPGTVKTGPSNLTLSDVAAVGISSSGILGASINTTASDTTRWSDVYIIGNGQAGYNADSGGCGTSCEDIGNFTISNMIVDWNGCVPVGYDFTKSDTLNAYNYCVDQTNGGYGDGFVTIASNNVILSVTNSFFRWNTQDGFDSLHLSDDQTHSPTVSINASWSEGNEGQTFKLGAGAAATATNNVSINNCLVLATASNFPLNPTGWNSNLAGSPNLCRAQRDEWAFQLNNGTILTIENNTSIGYGTTMYDLECSAAPGETSCAAGGAKVIFNNNISLGFPDPGNSNRLPSGFFLGTGVTTAVFSGGSANNLWHNMFATAGCPDSVISPTPTNSQCGDPLMVAESDINFMNPNITNASSPAIGNGIHIPALTTDYNGNSVTNPPQIGAFALTGGGTVATPTCSPTSGTFGSAQSVTCFSSTPSSTTVCTIDGSTPTHVSPVCTAIAITTTATLKALAFSPGLTDSALGGGLYTITPPTVVSIAIAPTSATIGTGGTTTLACTATMTSGPTQACTSPVWTSATPAHATVNSSTGVVTGVAVGTSLVSAVASGFTSNNSTITVVAGNAYTVTTEPLVMEVGDLAPPCTLVARKSGALSSINSTIWTTAPTCTVPTGSLGTIGTYAVTVTAGTLVSGADSATYTNGSIQVIAPDGIGARLANAFIPNNNGQHPPPGFFSTTMPFAAIEGTSNKVCNLVGDGSTENWDCLQYIFAATRGAQTSTVTCTGSTTINATAGTSYDGVTSGATNIAGFWYTISSVPSTTQMILTTACPAGTALTQYLPRTIVSVVSGSPNVTYVSGPKFAGLTGLNEALLIGTQTGKIATLTDSTHLVLNTSTPLPNITGNTSMYLALLTTSPNAGGQPFYLHLTNGIYNVSHQLNTFGAYWSIWGDGAQSTQLFLPPNSADFQTGSAKPWFQINPINGNDTFHVFVRNLGLHAGKGNPTVVITQFPVSNYGAFRNDQVWSDDADCAQGINIARNETGPGMFFNVAEYGCASGFLSSIAAFNMTGENLTVQGNTTAGISNNLLGLQVRHVLFSEAGVPAMTNIANGANAMLMQSEVYDNGGPLCFQNSSTPAFTTSAFYLKGIKTNGSCTTTMNDYGTGSLVSSTGDIVEQSTGTWQSLFNSGSMPASLGLPIQETPQANDPAATTWALLDPTNVAGWQAALNACTSTTYYVPPGQLVTTSGNHNITVPDCVNHLQFYDAMNPNGSPYKLIFTIAGTSSTPLIIESCIEANCGYIHTGSRTVVFLDSNGYSYTSSPGAGNVFGDDFIMGGPTSGDTTVTFQASQNVWARAWNQEQPTTTKVACLGGTIWSMGLKTEHNGPNFSLAAGCKMENYGFTALGDPSVQGAGGNMVNMTDASLFMTGRSFTQCTITQPSGACNNSFYFFVNETQVGVDLSLPVPNSQTIGSTQNLTGPYYSFGATTVSINSFDGSSTVDGSAAIQ